MGIPSYDLYKSRLHPARANEPGPGGSDENEQTMAEEITFRCLRCGHEWEGPYDKKFPWSVSVQKAAPTASASALYELMYTSFIVLEIGVGLEMGEDQLDKAFVQNGHAARLISGF